MGRYSWAKIFFGPAHSSRGDCSRKNRRKTNRGERSAAELPVAPRHIWNRAIAAYLCNKYSTPSTEHLYPPAAEQRARVDELLYASEWIFETMKDFVNPPGVVLLGEKPNYHKEQDVNKALRYLEQTLGEGGFIAGPKETIADLFMITGCVMPRLINSRVYDNYPKLTKWMGRVEQLAFYDLCNKQALADFKRQMQSALHPEGTQL